jgi:ATP adenylyltransferase
VFEGCRAQAGGDIVSRVSEEFHNADRKRNLHAPWRIEYVRRLPEEDGCFLCRARDEEGREQENLLLWRSGGCLVVMNKFPYTAGHLLVAPAEHLAGLGDVSGEVMREMMELTRDSAELLRRTIRAEGFNIGINLGRCAGAGMPGHLHLHVVPRWQADTNFMAVLGDVRVVLQSLGELRDELLAMGEKLKLPQAVYGQRDT